MEEYPEELRTPPMPLVALVGVPELHSAISMFLHTEQPPLNTLALPDFAKVGVIGGKERKVVDARMPPPVGILKADWLAKHRTRAPAVLAVLLDREQVYGDPTQWLQVCTRIDGIKAVIRGRNIKLVVAVIQSSMSGEVNEDRLTALRKRADVDAKHCISFLTQDPNELKRSLMRLGGIMGELSVTFYREEGRRVKLRIEKRTYSSIELSVRYNFKVAVYAEFRRDWVTALKFYETSYSLLQEVITTPMELQPVQRIVELKAVAEQLHFKISTLLLHSGQESEAVKWFRQHMTSYKHLIGPSEGAFLHWAWVCKQYQVYAELLENSFATASVVAVVPASPGPPVTERELQPGFYYQVAALYMVQRRRLFEAALVTFEAFEVEGAKDVLAGPRDDLGPPLYIGQAPRLLKRGATLDMQSPTEVEYMRHAVAVEKGFPHSHAAIDLLTKAHEQFKQIQATRAIYQLGSEMGREYFTAREYANAKRLFDSVSGLYRKEAWVPLLGATLGYLKECARQLGLLQEYVEYALELAALPTPSNHSPGTESNIISGPEVGPAGPLCQFQKEHVHKEVVSLLQGTGSVLPAREGEGGLVITDTQPVALEVDLVSPLRIVLSASVAFHNQVAKPGSPTPITLSLITHLPLGLVVEELQIEFNQEGSGVLLRHTGDSNALDFDKKGSHDQDPFVKDDYDLSLEVGKWKRFSINIVPNVCGKLDCLAVIARVGPHSTIRCQVESPATFSGVPLWIFEPGLDFHPVKDTSLMFVGQKTIHVEELESFVDIDMEPDGVGLVGEIYPLKVGVTSKGWPVQLGELDVYFAPFSSSVSNAPRSMTPIATTPVAGQVSAELLSASQGSMSTYEFPTGQGEDSLVRFLGPLQIPSLGEGESWSTTLFIRWSEPSPLNVMTLLGYQKDISENGVCRRHRLQRNVQVECEDSLAVSSKYVAPFRRDALLPGGLGMDQHTSKVALPLNEMCILVVTVKNSCSLPICLISIDVVENDETKCKIRRSRTSHEKDSVVVVDPSIQMDEDLSRCSCSEIEGGQNSSGWILAPDELFTKLFHVYPLLPAPSLQVGTIHVKWRRHLALGITNRSFSLAPVTKLIPLSPVLVESPPLVVVLDCPSQAYLGVPLVCLLKVANQSKLLQEVTFSVYDTQGFIFSGAHSDTMSILPQSTHALAFKLVPIASGMQQLPEIRLTCTRYSAGFSPSSLSTQIFVFPSSPVADPPIFQLQPTSVPSMKSTVDLVI